VLRDELRAAICDLPVIDVHTHLARHRAAAESLWEVLLYHMIRYPLRAAGLSEEALWGGADFHAMGEAREEVLAHLPRVMNTGFGWALRTILRDLYDFDEPLTRQSLPRLTEAFEARASRPDWSRSVIDRASTVRILSSRTDVPPLEAGQDDLGIRFTIETAPTRGTHEWVTWPDRLAELGRRAGAEVASVAGLGEVVAAFYDGLDWSDKRALVSWVSSEADFTPADETVLDRILAAACRGHAPLRAEGRLLEGAFLRAICRAIRGRVGMFQICYGVQFVTPGRPHPVAKAASRFARTLGCLVGEFPELHFNLLSGCEADEPVLCALCLGYANVSLGGYWWHTFYPSVMQAAWHRRLDMVPPAALCGFFSDGWCIDWAYGRLRLTQRVLANVLAEKIEQGFYSEDQAVSVARELLFETPRRLFLPDDRMDA
jgi:hypothetical protein